MWLTVSQRHYKLQHWFAYWLLKCYHFLSATHSLYAWSFVRRTWLCPSCEIGIWVPPELLGLWNIRNNKLPKKYTQVLFFFPLTDHYMFSLDWSNRDLRNYWLRSWILRKMKKMRMAMRTMAMPAPITIPTIWGEKNKRRRRFDVCSTRMIFSRIYQCIKSITLIFNLRACAF